MRKRPAPTRADYEALSRALAAAGLDPEYWPTPDVLEMWSWNFDIRLMVNMALRREGKEPLQRTG
jgi:hypothetical protein